MMRYYVMVPTTWKSTNSTDMAAANSLSSALEIQKTANPVQEPHLTQGL